MFKSFKSFVMKYYPIFVFVCLSILFVLFAVKSKVIFESDDYHYHIHRLQALIINIKAHHLYPYLYTGGVRNIPYLEGVFYPQVTMIPVAVLCLLLGSLVNGVYIGFAIYTFIGLCIFYFVARRLDRSKIESIFITTVYAFCAYRSTDLFARFDIGEFVALTFIPLALYGLYAICLGNEHDWPSLGLGLSLVMLSHILSTLLCVLTLLVMLLTFIFVKKHNNIKWILINLIRSVVLFICSSAIFLFPFIEQELANSYSQPGVRNIMGSAASLDSLAGAALSNSLKMMQSNNQHVTYSIGIIMLFAILWGLIKFSNLDLITKYCLLFGSVTFLMASNIFVWKIAMQTPLQVIQYSFRILSISSCFLAIVAGKMLYNFINIPIRARIVGRASTIIVTMLLILIPWLASFYNYTASCNPSHNYRDNQYISMDNWYFGEYIPKMKHFNNYVHHMASSSGKIYRVKSIESIPEGLILEDSRFSNAHNLVIPVPSYKNIEVLQSGHRLCITKQNGLWVVHHSNNRQIIMKYKKSKLDNVAGVISICTWIISSLMLVIIWFRRHFKLTLGE